MANSMAENLAFLTAQNLARSKASMKVTKMDPNSAHLMELNWDRSKVSMKGYLMAQSWARSKASMMEY